MDLSDDFSDGRALIDATDVAILMHRDVHFGGKFALMIDYYEKEGKGIFADFDLKRINKLHETEQRLGKNLAPLFLREQDAERVAEARNAYKKLKKLYEEKNQDRNLKLIADLILSEEEEPEQEIKSIVAEGSSIVPALLTLIKSEEFHDPLFPGYGLAPALAAKCLGLIGDKRAITALFESIGEDDFFHEDLAIRALGQIGEPAKQFLLKVVHGKPITYDNERAAVALLQFKEDPQIASTCLNLLLELDLKQHLLFATHLVFNCQWLTKTEERRRFMQLEEDPKTPSMLRQDMKTVINQW